MGQIAENFLRVKERVCEAAEKSRSGDVSIVLVTKTVSSDKIKEAVLCGGKILGENRVQEAKIKIPEIKGDKIAWHMIGHLQKNKVKTALLLFNFIQSVDSLALGKALHACAEKLEIPFVNCLLQINIGKEDNKGGIYPERLVDTLFEFESYPRLKIQGLMAIPPFQTDNEGSRKYFRLMRKLWDQVQKMELPPNIKMDILSMGMSGDFEIAIEEGANMVRVGSAIFGNRIQK